MKTLAIGYALITALCIGGIGSTLAAKGKVKGKAGRSAPAPTQDPNADFHGQIFTKDFAKWAVAYCQAKHAHVAEVNCAINAGGCEIVCTPSGVEL